MGVGVANAANRVAAAVPDAWGLFSASGEVQDARAVLEHALARRSYADARVRGLLARLEWFDGRYSRALDLIGKMDAAGSGVGSDVIVLLDTTTGDDANIVTRFTDGKKMNGLGRSQSRQPAPPGLLAHGELRVIRRSDIARCSS